MQRDQSAKREPQVCKSMPDNPSNPSNFEVNFFPGFGISLSMFMSVHVLQGLQRGSGTEMKGRMTL